MLVEELPVNSSFTSCTRASGGDDVDGPHVRSGSALTSGRFDADDVVLVDTSAMLLDHMRFSFALISGKSLLMDTRAPLLVDVGGCSSYGLFLCSSC